MKIFAVWRTNSKLVVGKIHHNSCNSIHWGQTVWKRIQELSSIIILN